MNNELTQLANKKGFFPENLTIGWKEDYYLWMCSLQKWLREVYNIHVCVDLSCITFEDGNNKWFYRIDDVITNDYLEHSEDENLQFNKFEEALEIGLLKALQLIK